MGLGRFPCRQQQRAGGTTIAVSEQRPPVRGVRMPQRCWQAGHRKGRRSVALPPQSPNLNAHCERFVCSIKEEALCPSFLQ
jgi:hypothetical protein